MTETITTTELLDFLAKAHKVFSKVRVIKEDEGYTISVHCDWHNLNNFEYQITFITDEGKSKNDSRYKEFHSLNCDLDQLVREKEERLVKRQKRQELLSRLTDEEKELLGVK